MIWSSWIYNSCA